MGNSITVHSPATVSNLCCGFDVLGVALNEPYDEIYLEKKEQPGIHIEHTDLYGLSIDPTINIAGVALQSMSERLKLPYGFNVKIHKGIKPGSGIGSSAASAAGIVVAANELLSRPCTQAELLQFALDGEMLASGTRHADNLAPCIYGGLVLVRDMASADIISLGTPDVFISVLHPQIEIKTAYARQLLPKEISLSVAVKQWANVGALVAGFAQNNASIISRSLQDYIAEPVRGKLIPGFDMAKQQSMEAGALGGGISGSGPSIFMISETAEIASKVVKSMKAVFDELKIDSLAYVSRINTQGVKVVTRKD